MERDGSLDRNCGGNNDVVSLGDPGQVELYPVMESRGREAPPADVVSAPERVIPAAELRYLALTVADARDRAQHGSPRRGYALLLAGFGRADRALAEGHPWAGALARCWRDAIDHFCEEFSPSDED